MNRETPSQHGMRMAVFAEFLPGKTDTSVTTDVYLLSLIKLMRLCIPENGCGQEAQAGSEVLDLHHTP